MVPLALVVLLVLALCRWGVEPLVAIGTPLLELRWLGWALLAALVWLFATPARR